MTEFCLLLSMLNLSLEAMLVLDPNLNRDAIPAIAPWQILIFQYICEPTYPKTETVDAFIFLFHLLKSRTFATVSMQGSTSC